MTLDPQLDLEVSRIIKAPRASVWKAWTTPDKFAKWWIPAPALCRVQAMELRPGGALTTLMSEDGSGEFGPHLDACFLEIEEGKRIVFTNALVGGWRPAEQPMMTAIITMEDHDLGTAYRAVAMHKNHDDQAMHEKFGFYDGWGTVTAQLAALVE
jgi:uncharacterized protein YndB with AHSA1/START domain